MRATKKSDMSFDMSILEKAGELKSRLGFLILALLIYRLGSFVPLPGLDAKVLKQLTAQTSGGMLEMFNLISGGSLSRMSLFALSIMPYITASIIFHLLSVMVPKFDELRKSGEAGRAKINQYTKYFTLLLAVTQAYGITSWLINMAEEMPLLVIDEGLFKLIAVSTLSAGTMLLMWLGDQINNRGIGNGISLIIFAGIVSSLPSSFISLFQLSRNGSLSALGVVVVLGIIIGLFVLIVYVEKATRRIPISYPKKQVGNKVYAGDNTHMPLKLNTAGVIPPIFASSLLLFPQTLVNFFSVSADDDSLLAKAVVHLGHGKPLYMLVFAMMIFFFAFFYTSIIFNPEETAENLRKYGGHIPGKRPGSTTVKFFDQVLTKLTAIGAVYLVVICLLPELVMSTYSIPFILGGTSLLIMVNVVLDFVVQLQSHLFSAQYKGMIKKIRTK